MRYTGAYHKLGIPSVLVARVNCEEVEREFFQAYPQLTSPKADRVQAGIRARGQHDE